MKNRLFLLFLRVLTLIPTKSLSLKDLFPKSNVVLVKKNLYFCLNAIQRTANLQSKEFLSHFFSDFDLTSADSETLDFIQKFLVQNQNQKVCVNILASFKTKLPFQFLAQEFKPKFDILPDLLTLFASFPSNHDILDFSLQYFDKFASIVSLIMLKNSQNLSDQQKQVLIKNEKFLPFKYQSLILSKLFDEAVTEFSLSPKQFSSSISQVQPIFLIPFLEKCIFSTKITNEYLLLLSPIVLKNKSQYPSNIACLFSKKFLSQENLPFLLSLFQFRPFLVSIVLATKDFSTEEENIVSYCFSDFLGNPITSEDENLLKSSESIVFEHSSASQLKELKEELLHPSGQTDLPKLRKNIEKTSQKVEETQRKLRLSLQTKKIEPVQNCLFLLEQHYLSAFSKSSLSAIFSLQLFSASKFF